MPLDYLVPLNISLSLKYLKKRGGILNVNIDVVDN